ncbi:Kinase superfamily protein isoform 1 [Tripterygium wilfordii]|uniref:Kinase superfamily protein isoform 1 n=1 Tax=Tripterygium wilfordii TaxID=458696 RepID=A0A7J7DF74_TRIWF|nr:probable receptor-like protein kinase At1g49730 [Tripterygium wilfordii]KAF5744928.1 Kinase superfamily protein isoform 1 [Tripterygium wilfordii]
MDHLIHKIRSRILAWLHRSRSGKISFLRCFSYKDIKRATDGFHRIIYSNSQGAAYKATFQDGGIALVKEVKAFTGDENAFNRELEVLASLHHRHLLALRGFSYGHKRFLVFDNIENGSLKEHLNDPLKTPLSWKTRLEIAISVAAALEYLILFINPPIHIVSISSSTIMLDENFTVKLSDVGLLGSTGHHVKMPPALSLEDGRGQECDDIVFQLGVLILELVTGQSSGEGGTDLIEWIQEAHFSSSIYKMIDPDLGNNYDSRELKILLAVARLCIKPVSRPTCSIPQIFRYLQKKVDISQD